MHTPEKYGHKKRTIATDAGALQGQGIPTPRILYTNGRQSVGKNTTQLLDAVNTAAGVNVRRTVYPRL